jgi:hypothetical protein
MKKKRKDEKSPKKKATVVFGICALPFRAYVQYGTLLPTRQGGPQTSVSEPLVEFWQLGEETWRA